PAVVRAVDVRHRAPRIDLDGLDRAATANAIDEVVTEVPHLHRKPDLAYRSTDKGQPYGRRHDHRSTIAQIDARHAVRAARHGIDCRIEPRRRKDPFAPEPIELHARLVTHDSEEIG